MQKIFIVPATCNMAAVQNLYKQSRLSKQRKALNQLVL